MRVRSPPGKKVGAFFIFAQSLPDIGLNPPRRSRLIDGAEDEGGGRVVVASVVQLDGTHLPCHALAILNRLGLAIAKASWDHRHYGCAGVLDMQAPSESEVCCYLSFIVCSIIC